MSVNRTPKSHASLVPTWAVQGKDGLKMWHCDHNRPLGLMLDWKMMMKKLLGFAIFDRDHKVQ